MSFTPQAATAPLPRGPHKLSREEVLGHQRTRILQAIVEAVAAKGYAASTIGDVTSRARVSRDSFYGLFDDKEACFLAAYDAITDSLLENLVATGLDHASYVDGMREGVRAFLRFWRENPDAAHTWMDAVYAAGPEALAHRERALRRFERLFVTVAERGRSETPGLPVPPATVVRALTAGCMELTSQYVRQGRVEHLDELEDGILYAWLMGMAGHEVASRALATAAGPN